MSKKVLVIGCTGTMGRALVDFWVQKGYETWGICRSRNVLNEAAHYMYGDATDEDFMKKVLESADYDAIADFMWYTPELFEARVDALLDATKHYICLSSCAVSAHSDKPIKEEDPRFFDIASEEEKKDRGRHYHLEKARIENLIRMQEKKNWTIIRPHVTMNSNHISLTVWNESVWLWRAAHNLPIVVYEDLQKPYSTYTMAIDVAKMIDAIICNGAKSYGDTYNVVSDTVLSGEQLLNMYEGILREHGIQMNVVRKPNTSSYYEWSPSDAERITYDRARSRVFDNSKIKAIANIKYEVFTKSLKGSIEEWLNKYNSETIGIQSISEFAYIDRLLGIRTPLKYFRTSKAKKNYIINRYPYLKTMYNSMLQPVAQFVKNIKRK